MIGLRSLSILAAAALVTTSAAAAEPRSGAPAAQPADVIEVQAFRRSGVVSAWLTNGIRVHHRYMSAQSGQVEVMISFAGGELLECGDTRGLTLLSATCLDNPASTDATAEQLRDRLRGRDIHLEGGVASDALLVRIWGEADDIGPAFEVAAIALRKPRISDAQLAEACTAASRNVERAQSDTRWAITEPLLDLITPINECRNKPACTKRMSAFRPDQVEAWITRHASTAPCEIAVVGDIPLDRAIALVTRSFGEFPPRQRAGVAALAPSRCIQPQQGPFVREVGCRAETDLTDAHVLAGFLSPDPSEIQEVRRLRAGARVLSQRLEERLRELKLGGDPHVSWTYLPSPFAGRSMTVVAASVAPDHAEPVKQIMQTSLCELMDHGLPADELARSTEILARVASAYERDPRYWATMLARSTSGGLDPELICAGAEMYRSMKPDEVLSAMRRACTVENRLDLVVRPAAQEDRKDP